MTINCVLRLLFTIFRLIFHCFTIFLRFFGVIRDVATGVSSDGFYFLKTLKSFLGGLLATFFNGQQRGGTSGFAIIEKIGSSFNDICYLFSFLWNKRVPELGRGRSQLKGTCDHRLVSKDKDTMVVGTCTVRGYKVNSTHAGNFVVSFGAIGTFFRF